MRTLVPADSLVYLETNDLAAALQPIIDSKPFNEVAKSKPDFSALKGVQLAVAVTGFETSEEKVNDEQSIGRIQPRFVAIADTHAWNFQAVGFAETKLGSFVTKIYDSEPTLEKSEKNGGKYFTWTAADGRKAYALVIDSLIYFGNDESAIEKCLAVKRGESDNIIKTNKVQSADPQTLASGYVSTDGIAQIANIIGLKLASETSEDSEIQSAIAGIVPQLLRKSITEISWTATKTEGGIQDKYLISMPPDIANVFDETFSVGDDSTASSYTKDLLIAQLPANTEIATRYNLKNPQLALRSVLLFAEKQLGVFAGKAVLEFSQALFEPYGIQHPELFLSSLGGEFQTSRNIITARFGWDSEEAVVLTVRGNDQTTIRSLSTDLKLVEQHIEQGSISWSLWSTENEDMQLALGHDSIMIGSKDNLLGIHGVGSGEFSDIRTEDLRRLALSKSPIVTFVRDHESARHIAALIIGIRSDDTKAVSTFFTETRFTKTGIERKTTSDFGLIGLIIAQMAQD